MQQILIKLYEGEDLTVAVDGVIYVPVLDARTLTGVKVKTDENVTGVDAVFRLRLNGVEVSGADAITIDTGQKIGSVSGLSEPLVEGDELLLDLLSGSVSAPLTLYLSTAKTVNSDEITEVADKKFVTDAEKTKLANLSGTNSGNETAATVGALVSGAGAATPNDTDTVATAESSVLKKITWTNVKAFLKTYFDTLYGAKEILQNSQSAAYTAALSDSGKQILHPAADNNARTFTLPANSSVNFPVGTAITFVNEINTVTIAINTDTLQLAGSSSTGSRTLAANGIATAVKIASTKWLISGVGLS